MAALLRFVEEPRLLGVEWCDGAPSSVYVAGGMRDTILSALLDAAQSCAGRPIPLLPGHTSPGDAVLGSTAGKSGGGGLPTQCCGVCGAYLYATYLFCMHTLGIGMRFYQLLRGG